MTFLSSYSSHILPSSEEFKKALQILNVRTRPRLHLVEERTTTERGMGSVAERPQSLHPSLYYTATGLIWVREACHTPYAVARVVISVEATSAGCEAALISGCFAFSKYLLFFVTAGSVQTEGYLRSTVAELYSTVSNSSSVEHLASGLCAGEKHVCRLSNASA